MLAILTERVFGQAVGHDQTTDATTDDDVVVGWMQGSIVSPVKVNGRGTGHEGEQTDPSEADARCHGGCRYLVSGLRGTSVI